MKNSCVALLLLLAVTATAQTQIVLFSEDFEMYKAPNLPDLWTVASDRFGKTTDSFDGPALTFSDSTAGGDTASPTFSLIGYTSGQTITLTFDFGTDGGVGNNHPLVVGLSFSGSTDPDYWIAGSSLSQGLGLFADNSGGLVGTVFAATTTSSFTTVTVDLTPFVSDYVTHYGAGAVGNISLDFESWMGNGSTNSVLIDNIAVTAVPEPSTYAALAGATALGLACYRRRRLSAVG